MRLKQTVIALWAILACGAVQGADTAPAGVVECLLSLPAEAVANIPRSERQKGLKRAAAANGPMQVVDEKNGYVRIHSGDGKVYKKEYNICVALFPSPPEHPIVGVQAANHLLDCWPEFYQWTGKHWQDVTDKVVPGGVYPKYGFLLPQKGTTVEVRAVGQGEPMDLEEKTAFRMKWIDGKFVR